MLSRTRSPGWKLVSGATSIACPFGPVFKILKRIPSGLCVNEANFTAVISLDAAGGAGLDRTGAGVDGTGAGVAAAAVLAGAGFTGELDAAGAACFAVVCAFVVCAFGAAALAVLFAAGAGFVSAAGGAAA